MASQPGSSMCCRVAALRQAAPHANQPPALQVDTPMSAEQNTHPGQAVITESLPAQQLHSASLGPPVGLPALLELLLVTQSYVLRNQIVGCISEVRSSLLIAWQLLLRMHAPMAS